MGAKDREDGSNDNSGRVLVVAFDGLDYELIKKYDCGNIRQQEFGKIDIDEGINVKVTDELFASFLTGETFEDHGVISKGRPESDFLFKLERFNKYKFFRKFRGIRKKVYKILPINADFRLYDKKDLESDSFLDVTNSKDISVPSYSIGYDMGFMDILSRHGIKEAEEALDRFTKWKKWELFESMDEEYDVIMAHFHKSDHIHHWYWEVGKMDRVEEMYNEIDELAGEILDKAEETGFDKVIFMSDHGLPDVESGGHREQAFYSSNFELFGDKIPHITDFYDKIIDISEDEKEELSGVDL